jgi:hypothetical protein
MPDEPEINGYARPELNLFWWGLMFGIVVGLAMGAAVVALL